MDNTLIYIYGSGIETDFTELQNRLIDGYCLRDIADEGEEKLSFSGEGVSELIFSKNLDYIKIDAELESFKVLLFEFSRLLSSVEPKHIYSFGFTGDPNDYKPLPVFKNEQECERFLKNGDEPKSDSPS